MGKNVANSIFLVPVSADTVLRIVGEMRPTYSVGLDGISSIILKEIIHCIVNPFVDLINESLESGCFPDILKIAIGQALYKSGDKQNIENYRQLSILSTFSKVIERIVHDQITSFIDGNNLITPSQHGFRIGKSIETASCHLLNYIYRNLDCGKYVMSLFFDLSKAFDTVSAEFLSDKLYRSGIRGNALLWMESYLKSRAIITRVNDAYSQSQKITLGVPQGSVLGPLLFTLYVNDLPEHITNGLVTSFADDTTVTVAADTPDDLLLLARKVMDDVNTWCQRNRLMLNVDKTVIINFYNRRPLPSIQSVEGICFAPNNKFLGTMIDSTLSWTVHIDSVCSKLSKAFFAILQLKNTLDRDGLLSVYYALGYSHMSYNIVSWGCASTLQRVFVLQKRLIRLIFNLEPLQSCRDTFKSNQILTITSVFILRCVVYTRKHMSEFKKNIDNNCYTTRQAELLAIPSHATSMFKASPIYNCIKLYNALPHDLKRVANHDSFKSKIKRFLAHGCFYNVDEYFNRPS